MLQGHNTLAICGLDCLFHEFIQEAVSHRGWRVSNLQGVRACAGMLPEIAVVFCSNGLQQILDDIRVTRSVIPKAKIVVVGFQGRDDQMLLLVEQGMYASIPTSDGLSNFVSTLEQVLDHQVSCTGRLTQLVRNRIAQLSPEQNVAAALTHREREVLDLIAGGLSNKAIADRLGITTNTVKNHVHRLLEKLKARSRHDAAWIHSHSLRSFPTIGTIV
jgi:two-component system nitrate/nitrite response regulator NarL